MDSSAGSDGSSKEHTPDFECIFETEGLDFFIAMVA
jgi:hypothetical protein